MINVIAVIQVKSGKNEEFLNIFNAMVPAVRAEDGCLAYQATSDVEFGSPLQVIVPNSYTIVEKWNSIEALKAHFAQPHMADFIDKTADIIEKLTLQVTENL